PFPDLTLQGVVDRHLDGTAAPPPLDAERDDVPPAARAAIDRAVALEPSDRFESASAFVAAMSPESATTRPTLDDFNAVRRQTGEFGAPGSRRARALLVGAAVVALAAIGWGLWRRGRSDDAGAVVPVSPTAVAVFPFTVRGSSEVAYLSSGMVDLLTTDLDGAGELRGVDAHAVLGSLAADGGQSGASVTPTHADALARRVGAGMYVLGSVLESSGGRLRINASLYDRARSGGPVATASVEGASANLFDLVDGLATQLLATRRHGPGARLTRLAAVTTRSLPALKAYLEGESQLRAGHYDSAMFAYGRAVAADSQFALAYYRRAVAADWDAKFDDARASAEQAIRYSSRLADDDRALLVAFLAWQRGDADEAERLYRAALRRHPDNVEAWYNLGEVLFHFSAGRGGSMVAARPAFERALFLDPQNSDARLHLLDIAAKEGRRADFDSLLADIDARNPYVLRRRALRTFAAGTRAQQDSVLAEMRTATDGTPIVTTWGVATYLQDLPAAARVAALLTDPSREREAQAFGHVLLAQIALGEGRWHAAVSEADSAAPLDRVAALEYKGFLASLPFAPATARELRDVRGALTRWDAAAEAGSRATSAVLRTHNGVHPLIRLYLLGAIAARLGDDVGVTRAEAELRRAAQGDAAVLGSGSGSSAAADDTVRRALAADLAHAVRAQGAWHAGHAAEALSSLERINGEAPLELAANSPFYSHVAERYLRAEALHALGRDAEAARYYGGLAEGRFDIAFLAPAQLRLAEIAERLGDRRAAALQYARAALLWKDCDSELRPIAERARRKADEGQ
ncbi:MAG TPA: tetratricopeptide repeat protein, partial [Gemmatimonadaceae bacterium]|nr:tetratricopeptide repeat protein [Gemmatimonadaceae bacterium]